MKTFLKILGLIFLALYFTACAGGSGGGDSSGGGTPIHVPDNTPHDYRIDIGRESVGVTVLVEMTMTCDFGLSTAHTVTQDSSVPVTDGNPSAALALNACKNVTIQVKNVGANNLIYVVKKDATFLVNNITMTPGQVYNYQAGF